VSPFDLAQGDPELAEGSSPRRASAKRNRGSDRSVTVNTVEESPPPSKSQKPTNAAKVSQ